MKIGIVGSEAEKFTPHTEELARGIIRSLIVSASAVISGKCHLGGVDIYAAEEARKMGIPVFEFAPTVRSWSGGYMQRNIKIARASDKVVCITLRTLPAEYTGMRFSRCYHCNTDTHVKSGGCWTVKYARRIGKPGNVIVIDND